MSPFFTIIHHFSPFFTLFHPFSPFFTLFQALGTLANGDETYKVNAVARDPKAMDLPKDLPIHGQC